MISTLRSDIQRALLSREFLVGVIGMIVVMVFASVDSVLKALAYGPHVPDGFHAQIVLNGLLSDAVVFAAPIICALPFTSAFVDDIQSGFIKQFLPRSGINAYILGKVLACAISGGLVLFAGILLSYVISSVVFIPMETASSDGILGPSFTLLLGRAALFLLSGMFWSLLGFTIASTTKSRYMAYASPFILYYILIIMHERYFASFYYFYPKEWLNPTHGWVGGNWGLILMLSLCMIGFIAAFSTFARGKLRNG
jgi:hypothetical protein